MYNEKQTMEFMILYTCPSFFGHGDLYVVLDAYKHEW